jgi:uncharacterized membrane protein YccC
MIDGMPEPVQWLRRKDRNFLALRRAARTAIVMPALFSVGTKVIGNSNIATFAAFGSFAMLLLVDFAGPMRERLQSQLLLGLVGAAFVSLGTLASQEAWLAAVAMTVVAFGVLFAGVVSSVLAGATPSLLLAFILPVATKAPPSAVPDRVAGWAMAGAISLVAIRVLWPAPAHDPLRTQASAACRALAQRLHSDIAYRLAGFAADATEAHTQAVVEANAAVADLHSSFLANPYRPTGLSTPARTVVRLIDELNWLNIIVIRTSPMQKKSPVQHSTLAVKRCAADVLEQAAGLLDGRSTDLAALTSAAEAMRAALEVMEGDATQRLPVHRVGTDGDQAVEIVSSLDPSFRATELAFAVGQIAANVQRTVLAERRGWLDRILGRQPDGLTGTFAAAHERAAAHLDRHSVWLQNSVRGAVALGAAIFVANQTGVQHSFWVVLGTLSVLRSSALNTGQNIVRGLLGTAVGFAIGAALLVPVGSDTTALWVLLPIAILVAGVAPAVISFAAGQAGFTLTLVILFNIIAPAGWLVGLVRIEDVAIGAAVSLVVGVLFWPRGAGAALRIALAEAYADSAAYLAAAARFGVSRCARQPGAAAISAPLDDSIIAAAAARRLDDTFRTYLAERGAKPVPMAEITALLTGVASVRLAADAITELWLRDTAPEPGDRETARRELLAGADALHDWFDEFAASLTGARELPARRERDELADGRLIDAVRADLTCEDGQASATAVRVIWTGEHLDAVRRMQGALLVPARAALGARQLLGRPHVHSHAAAVREMAAEPAAGRHQAAAGQREQRAGAPPAADA